MRQNGSTLDGRADLLLARALWQSHLPGHGSFGEAASLFHGRLVAHDHRHTLSNFILNVAGARRIEEVEVIGLRGRCVRTFVGGCNDARRAPTAVIDRRYNVRANVVTQNPEERAMILRGGAAALRPHASEPPAYGFKYLSYHAITRVSESIWWARS